MRSPFPGMDPWLELRWRDVQASLIIYIRDQIQRQLPEPLVARAEEEVFVDVAEQEPRLVRPEVKVAADQPRLSSGGVATLAPPVAVAKPVLVHVPEPEVDRRVEIIDLSSGGQVVSVIEVLSPSNKLPGRAREAYEAKQREFIWAGVNLVEIDLVRQGRWIFSVNEGALLGRERTPYMVCVFRAMRSGMREFYPLPLREALPRIAIPLRPGDRDVALDLQQVIEQAYEAGRYHRTDYHRALDPPLPAEDAAWVADLLGKAGRL